MVEYGKIYEGDCVKLLPEMGYGFADLVCTDPSCYGEGAERRSRERTWVDMFDLALKRSGILAVIWPISDIERMADLVMQAGYIGNLYVVTSDVGKVNYSSEAVVIARHRWFGIPRPLERHFHSLTPPSWDSAFSVEIPQRIIETFCPPDGVVFDPFMGRGTTAVAAVRAGKRWVGCEIAGSLHIDLAYGLIEAQTQE